MDAALAPDAPTGHAATDERLPDRGRRLELCFRYVLFRVCRHEGTFLTGDAAMSIAGSARMIEARAPDRAEDEAELLLLHFFHADYFERRGIIRARRRSLPSSSTRTSKLSASSSVCSTLPGAFIRSNGDVASVLESLGDVRVAWATSSSPVADRTSPRIEAKRRRGSAAHPKGSPVRYWLASTACNVLGCAGDCG